MDDDNDIYEDYEQTNKSTGSGLVLAVPAMVLETNNDMIDPSKPMVVTGSEYENLSPDNQYYEQVEFVRGCVPPVRQRYEVEDSLYSIPQVLSSGNSSTTGLTTNIGKGFMAALGKRLSSAKRTLMKERKGRRSDGDDSAKISGPPPRPPHRTVEDMYSKPNKHSLPVLPDSSLVIVTHKTLNMLRRPREEDTKSYMSVHVQRAPGTGSNTGWRHRCSCDSLQLKKYSVMSGLVSTLVILLTVGMYFMSGNVVTVTPEPRSRNYVLETVDRATTWKDFDQINWGSATTRPVRPSRPVTSTSLRRSMSLSSSTVSWSGWSSWSQCTRNPCIKGETVARSRECLDRAGVDADMKICIKQGGVNVEMEPCFCF